MGTVSKKEKDGFPLRKRISELAWTFALSTAGAAGLVIGAVLVILICESIPVLLGHWLG